MRKDIIKLIIIWYIVYQKLTPEFWLIDLIFSFSSSLYYYLYYKGCKTEDSKVLYLFVLSQKMYRYFPKICHTWKNYTSRSFFFITLKKKNTHTHQEKGENKERITSKKNDKNNKVNCNTHCGGCNFPIGWIFVIFILHSEMKENYYKLLNITVSSVTQFLPNQNEIIGHVDFVVWYHHWVGWWGG